MKKFKCLFRESIKPEYLYLDKMEFKHDTLSNIKWRKHLFNEYEINWLKHNFIDFDLYYQVIGEE